MSSDADAFVRGILRQPDDTTARLVFADWLDERGGPGNAAWARYIRAQVEAAKHEAWATERGAQECILAAAVPDLSARLTVPIGLFARHARSLIQFLPPPRLAVRLAGADIPRAVLELVPESVVRENLVLPLALQERTLLVAAADPCHVATAGKLGFMLNKDVLAVGCDGGELRDAIDRHYGQTETESIDSVSYESPLVGLDGDWISGHLFSLFHTAFSRGMTGFELTDEGQDCRLSYLNHAGVADIGFLPTAAFRRLRDHLRAMPVRSEVAANGIRIITVDIPLLSGRPFPAAVTFRRRLLRTTSLRVDFLW